jgi:sugar phosphate isomerase/epimerase
MLPIGFHTDAFNSSYWSFEQCLAWAQANDVHYIECGTIDGVSWIHGLGYQPHVALWEDPILLRRKMDRYGVQFSQIDAAFPLSEPKGASLGLEYMLNSLRWAKLAGAPRIDTTDGLHKFGGTTEREDMDRMRWIYQQLVPVAEAYDIVISIEPHGYYTTKPEFMAEMLDFVDSPCLRMNLDTGNTFIAGQDPVAFAEQFKDRIGHIHIKDVSQSLADAARGDMTGIAVSQCAIGDGVNADNIRRIIELMVDHGYRGVLSMECEGQGGPMIERSLAWLRETLVGVEARAATPAS